MNKKVFAIAIIAGLAITGLTYFVEYVPTNPDVSSSYGFQSLLMQYQSTFIYTIPNSEVAAYQVAHPYQFSAVGFPFVYYAIGFDATSHIIFSFLAFFVDFLIYFIVCYIVIFLLDRAKEKRYAVYQHKLAMQRYSRRKIRRR